MRAGEFGASFVGCEHPFDAGSGFISRLEYSKTAPHVPMAQASIDSGDYYFSSLKVLQACKVPCS